MRWIVVGVLALHGLIHAMGFAKAFGLAELPQLVQPISRAMGVAWLLAGGLVIATAGMLAIGSRHTWLAGAVAILLSQAVILSAWRDAWAGTLANLVLLLVVAHSWFMAGPRSFQAQFGRDAAVGLARLTTADLVTDADLAPLPEPVQRYLRLAGVVGQPRVHNYRLRFRGRIRSAPDSAWMPFAAEQQSFADQPARLFHMRARMFGVPVDIYHRLIGGQATMQVKILGAFPVADAKGSEMDRSEAVTLFNDMCLLAPATLLDRAVTWQPAGEQSARARFTNGSHTISAELVFDADGRLSNFISDDRSRSSPDGKTFTQLHFSTPVRNYRAFGPARLMSFGEARWRLPEGEFTYGEFELLDIAYNVPPALRSLGEGGFNTAQ